ncbi:hypothetical protein [Yoonia sediminilitoris]|uniref:Uncharacterized protein n=1 Tax=Yoonia sediminilitoris TaxID=1286148 RepID=A0A2T6KFQ6_9RHOB|nr:hypothetical protein [Yoonia sediminilitoris]PUB14138.1 hypothetical protein C8N45_10611 [Yoonia sediminilitoris]RCW95069.1 hypothetical protein DFP92_10611 [Yoonia sediminilitoris]
MQFIKLVVFGAIALTIIYFSISLYSKSVRRERLEDQFDEDPPEGAGPEDRDAFVAKGMTEYENSIRPKLIGLVFVVPVIAISVIIYIVN